MIVCSTCGHDKYEHYLEEYLDPTTLLLVDWQWLQCEVDGCNCQIFKST